MMRMPRARIRWQNSTSSQVSSDVSKPPTDSKAVRSTATLPLPSQSASCWPLGVVPDRHDEGDDRLHRGGAPSVQSGRIPDGSTLNTSYIFGMLVNISTMKVSVQTIR